MLESERRRAKRVEFREPIQYRPLGSEETHGSLGFDLSESGIRFQTEDFIPLHKPMAMHIELGSGQGVNINGEVVWVQLVPHSERYHVGLTFKDADSQRTIQQYINSRPN